MRHVPSRNRAFAVVLAIELWERFGYYAMQAILLLFLIQALHFGEQPAVLLSGAFAAIVYTTPVLGGWLGDHVLGARRAMVLGASTLTAGYGLLALPPGWLAARFFPASLPWDDASLLLPALSAIAIGNGLFKPNAAALVRAIHEGDDHRLDAAFTLYYMAVNVGSTVSMLLTPWIKDHAGWHAAFGISCLGLAVGLATYAAMRPWLGRTGSAMDHHPLPAARYAAIALGAAALGGLIVLLLQSAILAVWGIGIAAAAVAVLWIDAYRKAAARERPGLAVMYGLAGQTVLFFIFYQQMSTSLTLFAVRGVDPVMTLGGVTLMRWSPAQFQALDPIWIMIQGPLLAAAYTALARHGRDPGIHLKFVAGFVSVGIAFALWWAAAVRAWPDHPVSAWVMVAGYGALALGELLIGGLGLAMVARYVPQRLNSFMMGTYLLSAGLSMYLGSRVASFSAQSLQDAAAQPAGSFPAVFVTLFGALALAAFLAAGLCLAMAPWLQRLDRRHRG